MTAETELFDQRSLVNLFQESCAQNVAHFVGGADNCLYQGFQRGTLIRERFLPWPMV